jgi:hypothetical protein
MHPCARMASKQHAIKYDPNGLPLRGPAWSFYFFALLALLTFLAIIVGFVHAGALTG